MASGPERRPSRLRAGSAQRAGGQTGLGRQPAGLGPRRLPTSTLGPGDSGTWAFRPRRRGVLSLFGRLPGPPVMPGSRLPRGRGATGLARGAGFRRFFVRLATEALVSPGLWPRPTDPAAPASRACPEGRLLPRRPPLAGRAGAGPLGPGAAAPARLAARSFWRP